MYKRIQNSPSNDVGETKYFIKAKKLSKETNVIFCCGKESTSADIMLKLWQKMFLSNIGVRGLGVVKTRDVDFRKF